VAVTSKLVRSGRRALGSDLAAQLLMPAWVNRRVMAAIMSRFAARADSRRGPRLAASPEWCASPGCGDGLNPMPPIRNGPYVIFTALCSLKLKERPDRTVQDRRNQPRRRSDAWRCSATGCHHSMASPTAWPISCWRSRQTGRPFRHALLYACKDWTDTPNSGAPVHDPVAEKVGCR